MKAQTSTKRKLRRSKRVLDVFARDIDFTLVEKNLRLTTEQRAQQLVNATRFIRKFRPLVQAEAR